MAIKCFTGAAGATGATGVSTKESYRFSGTSYVNSYLNTANEERSASGTVDVDAVNGGFQRNQACPSVRAFPTDRCGYDNGQLVVEGVDCGTNTKEFYYFAQ